MSKEAIEQIKKIKGVKTVEVNGNQFAGTFEPEKVVVKWKTDEHIKFIEIQRGFKTRRKLKYIAINRESMVRHHSNADAVIPFTQYLKDYNLQDEWEKYLVGEAEKRYPVGTEFKSAYDREYKCKITSTIFMFRDSHIEEKYTGGYSVYFDGKWAEIIPEEPEEIELVYGEIYFQKFPDIKGTIFRKGCTTLDLDDNKFYSSAEKDLIECSPLVPVLATTKQKKKLIKTEVKNGYFHELNK